MNPAINTAEHEAMSRALRARILNVLPAATYQMDRFFQFADIVLSDRSETACVEVGPQPRLHLNAAFVRKHCRRDEHLLMLVLHELYHVILGHTRLFPRLTEAHNVAFDAVINSLLCRQFRDPQYLSFFNGLNGLRRFPGRLLRPPKGWPDRCVFAADVSEKERTLMELLYGQRADSVTYQEILDLLQGTLPERGGEDNAKPAADDLSNDKAGYVLLGDHGGQNGSGQMDETAVADALVKDILRRVTDKWPAGASLGMGRGDGQTPFSYLMPKPRNPRAEFLAALRRLLDRAGVLRPGPGTPYAWQRVSFGQERSSVLPDWRDRHAHSREALMDCAPLLYRNEVNVSRLRWRPRHVAHVYLDISGSMNEHLPWLAGALEPLQRRGLCRLYAFSTVVAEVRRGGLLQDRIANTFGTDIRCVYDHFLGLPRQRKPQRVVVLTDGLTGKPNPNQVTEARGHKVSVSVGLVGGGCAADLQECAASIESLPSLGAF